VLSAESVNTNAGLGFNGYDDRGVARWDLIDNADIVKVEVCWFSLFTSLLVCSDFGLEICEICHLTLSITFSLILQTPPLKNF